MNEHIKSTECPFAWTLDENLVLNLDEDNELYVDVGEEPVLALVNSIVLSYCRAIKGDHSWAKIKIKETEEIWDKLDLRQIYNEGISPNMLEHVKQATAYHVHHLSGDSSKAELIMAVLADSQSLRSPLDQSTLEGCKSIAWLSFHETGFEFALRHVKKASSLSPTCALWHFLRAKCHRYARRLVYFSGKPSDEERREFLRCRELSARPFYAIFVAQMHRENGDVEVCQQMYRDIYEDCLQKSAVVCVGALLRLALVFTRSKDFKRANACLMRVEKIKPKNSMFLHYKGIYLMKTRNFKLAKEYLEDAGKMGNYHADMELITSNKSLDGNFDCVGHLKIMLRRYKFNKYRKMHCLLHIAMQYYNEKDYVNSAEYFKKAIDLDIEDQQLKDFRNVTIDWKYYNIFNFVCDYLLPKLRRLSSNSSVDLRKMINYLKTQCESRREAQSETLLRSFNMMNLR